MNIKTERNSKAAYLLGHTLFFNKYRELFKLSFKWYGEEDST